MHSALPYENGTGLRRILCRRFPDIKKESHESDINFSSNTATFRDTKNRETRTLPLSPISVSCLLEEKKKRVIISKLVFPSWDGKKPPILEQLGKEPLRKSALKFASTLYDIQPLLI